MSGIFKTADIAKILEAAYDNDVFMKEVGKAVAARTLVVPTPARIGIKAPEPLHPCKDPGFDHLTDCPYKICAAADTSLYYAPAVESRCVCTCRPGPKTAAKPSNDDELGERALKALTEP